MYLLDTNIISELRKRDRANPGVTRFFQEMTAQESPAYISVITIGELRRGVDIIQHRGDRTQAQLLETWLQTILDDYAENILDFGQEAAQVWGRLQVPHPKNALDKQIAATALVYGLTLVTRNVRDFGATDIPLLDPFESP
jgi:toxin FitB